MYSSKTSEDKNNNKQYCCPVCPKEFNKRSNLYRHAKSIHRLEFQKCTHCRKYVPYLSTHYPLCLKTFSRKKKIIKLILIFWEIKDFFVKKIKK